MNKKLYYTICSSVIGAFFIVLIILFFVFSINNNVIKTENEATGNKKSHDNMQNMSFDNATKSIDEHYLVLCENENLIVYHISADGKKTFYDRLDINVSNLRKTDKEAFLSGVAVKDKIELAHIIEDYSS